MKTVFAVGEKTWFRGDEITIISAPYQMHGCLFQDGVTNDGKIVSVVPPGQREAHAKASMIEWEKQQEQFAKLRKLARAT